MFVQQQQVSTVQHISTVPIVAPVSRVRDVSDDEVEALRFPLLLCSFISVLGGLLCLATFWAVYYLGVVLAIGALTVGFIQMSHTLSAKHARSSGCCSSPRAIFGNLFACNIALVCAAGFGVLVCAIAIWLSFRYNYWTKWATVAGMVGCVLCGVGGAFSIPYCSGMQNLLNLDRALEPETVAIGSITTSTVTSNNPVYPVQTVTTYTQNAYPQPSYAQAGYAQQQPYAQAVPMAQPYYGQNMQQQQVYGQPAYVQQGQVSYGQYPQQQHGYAQATPYGQAQYGQAPNGQATYGQPVQGTQAAAQAKLA